MPFILHGFGLFQQIVDLPAAKHFPQQGIVLGSLPQYIVFFSEPVIALYQALILVI